ncbi:MAG: hypothetical protein JNM56_35855 [Planctomycetia bacterium]|nr:hypothetical protein [Planctomycetia bacterium]
MGDEASLLAERAAASAIQAEAPKPKPPPARPTSLYFVNAWVDFGVIGGISLLVFAYFYFFTDGKATAAAAMLSGVLLWIGNHPHFSATNYRLYHSRENIMQYPITALVIPWVILAGMIASFLAPLVVAPYFVKLFLIWSPYHFSGQSVGISLIYARRAGFFVGKLERFALSSFIFGTFLVQTGRAETYTSGNQIYGIQYPGMGIPTWLVDVFEVWMYLAGLLFLVLVARWCGTNRRLLPPIVLLPAATQYVWFVLGSRLEGYQMFVPFFHSFQYLLIAWSMQLKEKMDLQHIEPSSGYVVKESFRWGALNFVGGALLFIVFPYVASYYGSSAGLTVVMASGITIAAVQLHHFFVDGVIWKLKKKSVSSPLMVNLSDMVRPAPVAAA